MSADKLPTYDRKLLEHARDHFFEDNIHQALDFFEDNRRPLRQRLHQFDMTIASLQAVMVPGALDPQEMADYHANASRLAQMTNPSTVRSLQQIDQDLRQDVDGTLYLPVHQAFRQIDARARHRWTFTKTEKDPGKLASGLLIEGYGVYLGAITDKPEVERPFVLAFEECLFRFHSDTDLLQDILPWMVDPEEIVDFSPGIQAQLRAHHVL